MITAVERGTIPVGDFTAAVEHEWNFGDERAKLSETERAAVQQLFDVAVFYSPFPDERARIPNYRDENDILLAAQACRETLQSKPANPP